MSPVSSPVPMDQSSSVTPPYRSRSRSSMRSLSSSSDSSTTSRRSSQANQGPCPTCLTPAAHDCPFSVNDDLLNRTLSEPATILRPPRNREQSRLILDSLPFVERVKLCRLQGWCDQNLYPFCFFQNLRMGRSGLPNIFSSYTVSRQPQTSQLLREYLLVESQIILPKHIILHPKSRGFCCNREHFKFCSNSKTKLYTCS